jgi:inner membrane protein
VILWYAGGTLAIVRYAFRDPKMDLRFLALGAVLPDLIDKPVAVVFYSDLGSVRLVGHSLLCAALVMTAVVLATRRGRPRRRWMAIPIGMMVHLFLAFTWADPETLWWPFLGLDFTPAGAATLGDYLGTVLADPWVWVREAVGLVYLAGLWRRAGLADGARRSAFWRTGLLPFPLTRAVERPAPRPGDGR